MFLFVIRQIRYRKKYKEREKLMADPENSFGGGGGA